MLPEAAALQLNKPRAVWRLIKHTRHHNQQLDAAANLPFNKPTRYFATLQAHLLQLPCATTTCVNKLRAQYKAK